MYAKKAGYFPYGRVSDIGAYRSRTLQAEHLHRAGNASILRLFDLSWLRPLEKHLQNFPYSSFFYYRGALISLRILKPTAS
jgi:hypothetical protein